MTVEGAACDGVIGAVVLVEWVMIDEVGEI